MVVFYLYALDTPLAFNGLLIAALSVLVFVPIGYVYPSRTPFLRPLTLALGTLWGGALVVALRQLPHPSPALVWSSLAFPAYYFALSLHIHFRRRPPETWT